MASRSARENPDHPGILRAPPTRTRFSGDHPVGATIRPTPHPALSAARRDPAAPRTQNRHLPPLDDPDTQVIDDPATAAAPPTHGRRTDYVPPEKVTVMRVMARRSKYFAGRGVDMVHRAATADGADRSGLTALTMPVIANNAVDAAMAVALANTLFFAAATGESKVNVGLYLALTIAPFAVIAPLIGPLLDKLQHGRRIAMATTFGLRAVLALLIIVNSSWDPVTHQMQYKPWILYPCALGLMVLSKSFGVLKSAVAPRVLPPTIDLVRVNSRLTMFGLIFGTIVAGGLAAAIDLILGTWLPLHIPGAMVFLCLLAIVGAYFCMKIPAWVEVTEGEVPTTLTYRDGEQESAPADAATGGRGRLSARLAATMRQPLGRTVVTSLWGNGTIRILTGFLTLYIAFYAKAQSGSSGWAQLMMLGAVGAAAGIGNGIGNGIGTRLELKHPPRIIVASTGAAAGAAVLTAIFGSLLMVVVAALIASGVSAIAKVCLDSTIQDDLPEASRASAFGRSETVLQLCWVLGASLGVVLPTTLWIGFTVVAVLMAAGFAQTVMTSRGATLVPGVVVTTFHRARLTPRASPRCPLPGPRIHASLPDRRRSVRAAHRRAAVGASFSRPEYRPPARHRPQRRHRPTSPGTPENVLSRYVPPRERPGNYDSEVPRCPCSPQIRRR
ncbi:MFS transporter [Gordonia alkaliphila]|uniref:MFS transporter n=1 Tax=Gordonia alkaliphila TaxID=1053547 RepID=UPI00355871C6